MKWNDLVKSRMKETGTTQNMMAEEMNLSQSAIAHWLAGNRKPSIEDIAMMMKVVGMKHIQLGDDGYVEYPDNVIENTSSVDDFTGYKGWYPLINSVQAGQWTEVSEGFCAENSARYYPSDVEMIPSTEKASEDSFWLTVEGDSMTSSVGLSVPSGTRILVDPHVEATHNRLVVAKLDNVNEATFKQLVIDAGQKYLKPLNSAYQIIPINGNCRIVGVVVDAKIKLI